MKKTLYTVPANRAWPKRGGKLYIVDMTVFDGKYPEVESAIRDLSQTNWKKIKNPDLGEAMYAVKTSREVLDNMCDDLMENEAIGVRRGHKEGVDEANDKVIARAVAKGFSFETAGQLTGLTAVQAEAGYKASIARQSQQ